MWPLPLLSWNLSLSKLSRDWTLSYLLSEDGRVANSVIQGDPGELQMYLEPIILPLDLNGTIYALLDEKGNTIGTGTREVCEVLLCIITKPLLSATSGGVRASIPQRSNLRAAITI